MAEFVSQAKIDEKAMRFASELNQYGILVQDRDNTEYRTVSATSVNRFPAVEGTPIPDKRPWLRCTIHNYTTNDIYISTDAEIDPSQLKKYYKIPCLEWRDIDWICISFLSIYAVAAGDIAIVPRRAP